MTSTNDGKDVKSNQTSGQKGKTYYIELYKSLEAGLSGECDIRERTQFLCEAWRRVYTLCQHSVPSTQAHLLSWLQRHTSKTLLQTEWQSPTSKDEHAKLDEAISYFISECRNEADTKKVEYPPWQSQLVQRGQWFQSILPNPWGNPVLKRLLDSQAESPTDEEVLEWLKEERGVMFLTRLRQLAASKCDDIALTLASAVMDRVRKGVVIVPDADQADDPKDKPKPEKTTPSFADTLRTEAGFTVDVWELLTDIEFVLLYKGDKRSQCIQLAKQTPLRNGCHLVERLNSRLETSPREKKLWKNAKEVAILIAQVVVARCMVAGACAGGVRSALYWCARVLARTLAPRRLRAVAASLAAPAHSAKHLHLLAAAVYAELKDNNDMIPFMCELYVRAITAGMNELERLKLKTEMESEARSAEQTLASWFTQLGTLLSPSDRIQCECTLTAFSVHPSPTMYEKIKAAPTLPPVALDHLEPKEETTSEFGSWANDSRSMTNLVKTSETLNLKQTLYQANVLSTAILTEGEGLGLDPDMCQDIAVLLSGPRLKTLSWDMDRELLLENCRAYMERTSGGTRAVTTELKYLNLDPKAFQHLPEDDEDENDMFYGIEKGYEHLVEFQEPDDEWEGEFIQSEIVDSPYESSQDSETTIRRKKKSKKIIISSDEDSDPLSFMAEAKRKEKKKVRPHSKERSKERRQKKSNEDPLGSRDGSQDSRTESSSKEKTKEKKPRKKREGYPKHKSLAHLVGMKVSNMGNQYTSSITDSDYDSQGKSSLNSLNSESNEEVVFDGLYSMDELKSPENSQGDKMGLLKNNEFSITDGVVAVNKPATETKYDVESDAILTYVDPKARMSILDMKSQPYLSSVREEVKKSISRLIEFRRKKNDLASMGQSPAGPMTVKPNASTSNYRMPSAILRPESPMPAPISPKIVTIPEIPKMYINKKQSEQLAKLKNEVNRYLNKGSNVVPSNTATQYGKPDMEGRRVLNYSALTNATIDPVSDILRQHSQHIAKSFTPPGPINVLTEKSKKTIQLQYIPFSHNEPKTTSSTDTPKQKNYQEFLKELQESINAGAVTTDKVSTTTNLYSRKEKPMNRTMPAGPINMKVDNKITPCAKPQTSPKKLDTSLNTFSRLSYMHKKQSDVKLHQVVNALIEYQDKNLKKTPTASCVERIQPEQKSPRTKCPQIKNETMTRPVKTPPSPRKLNNTIMIKKEDKPSTTVCHAASSCPVITSILQNNHTSATKPAEINNEVHRKSLPLPHHKSQETKPTSLSEKDQNDLLLLLRQQNKLNASYTLPKHEVMHNRDGHIPHAIAHSASSNAISTKYMPSADMPLRNKEMQATKPKKHESHKPKKSTSFLVGTNVQNSSLTVSKPSIPKTANTARNSAKTDLLEHNNSKKTDIKMDNKINSKNETSKTGKTATDWERVMDAILAQKTPSRGPKALDVALNKSSFEKAYTDSLQNQKLTKSHSMGELTGSKVPDLKRASSNDAPGAVSLNKNSQNPYNTASKKSASRKSSTEHSSKSAVPKTVQNSSDATIVTSSKSHSAELTRKSNQHDSHKKLSAEELKKQFICPLPKDDDPFISGIANSDYDLLEELMDDDLRQEIGELSTDEDDFNPSAPNVSKRKNVITEKRIAEAYSKLTNTIPISATSPINLCINSRDGKKTVAPMTSLKCDVKTPSGFGNTMQQESGYITSKIASSDRVASLSVNDNKSKVHKIRNLPIASSSLRNERAVMANSILPELDTSNLYIAAIPKEGFKNVVLLDSELVYNAYPQPTAQSTAKNVQKKSYISPKKSSNVTLYQKNQFAKPAAKLIATGNPKSITTKKDKSPVTDSILSTKTVSHVSKCAHSVYLHNGVNYSTDDLTLSTNDQLKVNVNNPKIDNKMVFDLKSNNGCDTKFPSDLQHGQQVLGKEVLGIVQESKITQENCMNYEKNQERLAKKRKSIINRKLSHRFDNEPIPLSFSFLVSGTSSTGSDDQLAIKDNDIIPQKEIDPISTSELNPMPNTDLLNPVINETKEHNESITIENSQKNTENETNKLDCRRILLRSSNKLDDPILIKQNSKQKVDEKDNVTLKDRPTPDIISPIFDNAKETPRPKARKRAPKKPKLTKADDGIEMNKKEKRSKKSNGVTKNSKKTKKNILQDVISNPNTLDFLDIEDELLGSKIPKIFESDETILPDASDIDKIVHYQGSTELLDAASEETVQIGPKPVETELFDDLTQFSCDTVSFENIIKEKALFATEFHKGNTAPPIPILTSTDVETVLEKEKMTSSNQLSSKLKQNFATNLNARSNRHKIHEDQNAIVPAETVNTQANLATLGLDKCNAPFFKQVISEIKLAKSKKQRQNIEELLLNEKEVPLDHKLKQKIEGTQEDVTEEQNQTLREVGQKDIIVEKEITQQYIQSQTSDFVQKQTLEDFGLKQTSEGNIQEIQTTDEIKHKDITVEDVHKLILENVEREKITVIKEKQIINEADQNPIAEMIETIEDTDEVLLQTFGKQSSIIVKEKNISSNNNDCVDLVDESPTSTLPTSKEDMGPEIPQDYKDSIKIEQIFDDSKDPLKKCLRIKLPNGRTFKATVHGRVLLNFDALFEDPSLKAILLSNLTDRKCYTLNIKQVSTACVDNPHRIVETRIQEINLEPKVTPDLIETINLLSDDEDEEVFQYIETEFGKYKIQALPSGVFSSHQKKFKETCQVSLIKIDEQIANINNIPIHSKKKKTRRTLKRNPIPPKINNDIFKEAEIIHIVDSSSDCFVDILNCEQKHKNNEQVVFFDPSKDLNTNCYVKLTNCDDLIKKYKSKTALKPKYIVDLVRFENKNDINSCTSKEDHEKQLQNPSYYLQQAADGRTSPVMEAYELIATSYDKVNKKRKIDQPILSQQRDSYLCKSLWRETKPIFSNFAIIQKYVAQRNGFRHVHLPHSVLNDSPPTINNQIFNPFDLKTLVLKYFQNNPELNYAFPPFVPKIPKCNGSKRTSPLLKRKLETEEKIILNKIPKFNIAAESTLELNIQNMNIVPKIEIEIHTNNAGNDSENIAFKQSNQDVAINMPQNNITKDKNIQQSIIMSEDTNNEQENPSFYSVGSCKQQETLNTFESNNNTLDDNVLREKLDVPTDLEKLNKTIAITESKSDKEDSKTMEFDFAPLKLLVIANANSGQIESLLPCEEICNENMQAKDNINFNVPDEVFVSSHNNGITMLEPVLKNEDAAVDIEASKENFDKIIVLNDFENNNTHRSQSQENNENVETLISNCTKHSLVSQNTTGNTIQKLKILAQNKIDEIKNDSSLMTGINKEDDETVSTKTKDIDAIANPIDTSNSELITSKLEPDEMSSSICDVLDQPHKVEFEINKNDTLLSTKQENIELENTSLSEKHLPVLMDNIDNKNILNEPIVTKDIELVETHSELQSTTDKTQKELLQTFKENENDNNRTGNFPSAEDSIIPENISTDMGNSGDNILKKLNKSEDSNLELIEIYSDCKNTNMSTNKRLGMSDINFNNEKEHKDHESHQTVTSKIDDMEITNISPETIVSEVFNTPLKNKETCAESQTNIETTIQDTLEENKDKSHELATDVNHSDNVVQKSHSDKENLNKSLESLDNIVTETFSEHEDIKMTQAAVGTMNQNKKDEIKTDATESESTYRFEISVAVERCENEDDNFGYNENNREPRVETSDSKITEAPSKIEVDKSQEEFKTTDNDVDANKSTNPDSQKCLVTSKDQNSLSNVDHKLKFFGDHDYESDFSTSKDQQPSEKVETGSSKGLEYNEVNVPICDDSDNFDLIIPKNTYTKKFKIQGLPIGCERKSKRIVKRKRDMTDYKFNQKRYRKSKNIDSPRSVVSPEIIASYRREYKDLFDYHSSLKFSYSRPFHKENIEVHEILKNWPITNTPTVENQPENVAESLLFLDLNNKEKSNNITPQSLADELVFNEVEINNHADEIRETNFQMGFGERSGRVIQNLEDGEDVSDVSAATLSDVKQNQPVLQSKDKDYFYQPQNTRVISKNDLIGGINLYYKTIQLKNKVKDFFKKSAFELCSMQNYEKCKKDSNEDRTKFPFGLNSSDFFSPPPVEMTVQVVQVGQLPVSAAAQNPVTCDPRVTQVSDASPPQCSAENGSLDDQLTTIKTEYTELTTADITLPIVHEYHHHEQSMHYDYQESSNIPIVNENIPIQTEIKSVVKIELMEEEEKLESHEMLDHNCDMREQEIINNVEYSYEIGNTEMSPEPQPNMEMMYDNQEQCNDDEEYAHLPQENGFPEKTDQIAHAMNAAGISTTGESLSNSDTTDAHDFTMLQNVDGERALLNGNDSYHKSTAINAVALQQALAQILPPLNQTNNTENNQQTTNAISSQVLHIVHGKNASNNQITLVDNAQPTVINPPNATPVLHIVQNKNVANNGTSSAPSTPQHNAFSGLSLVDAALQKGGNQLLHIVNAGNQTTNNTGQLLKRVNLLTNLTNAQGGNEQKMVQFVCKSADGKPIQLSAAHQRSMVLRLQPVDTSAVQSNPAKTSDSPELSPTHNIANVHSDASQEIKPRSVYDDNYVKYMQGGSTPGSEKGTSLPKFNQAFGKQVYQDDKQNELNGNAQLSSVSSDGENAECPAQDNPLNLDHMGQINSPPLLLRKSPSQTTQSQPNIVQQIKETIAPMNIQTMHGGVIYTRQIPVNIGGGQTINLITVPTTELVDESGQKQQTEVKFVNQSGIEPSIIKIVPQTQTSTNGETPQESNTLPGGSNETNPAPQPQPVLTQMRIKLPMLSKAPNMVSGARVIRPSFFHIQRNVIGGANQQVYQQLVLTAAPQLGQQTIRLPQAQNARPQKAENSGNEAQMSTSTLEQLREFDLVLEQVKERSTVQPSGNVPCAFTKVNTSSSDTTDSAATATSTTEATQQQVLYSIGNTQPLNVAYVNRKTPAPMPTTSTYVRSPDSSGIVDSSTSSSTSQASTSHKVTTEARTSDPPPQPKKSHKSKSRPKASSNPPNTLKLTTPPKPSSQKPLEDEQTTQRILYILAEYKEQVENSPDKDKPAPRRRNNPPTTPSGSSKRKKGSGSRRHGPRDMSPIHGDETCRTMGSEDSSCGTSLGDCNDSCIDSHSPQDSPRKVVRKLTFDHEPHITHPRPQPQRNVILADGQTITVARGTAGKPTTAVLMPANYILPVSMVKGGQQIAIVTNRGPKLLTVSSGGEGTTNALLLQRLIGPAGLKPVLARPGFRHVRLPAAALHNLQAFNLTTATTVQPPDSTASPAPAPTPPELVETRATSSPWAERESQEVKPERGSSPEGSEPWNLHAVDPHDYSYEETVRTENMDRTVLDPIPDRYSPDMEAQRIFDKMFDVDSKKSYMVDSHDDSPRCGYDLDTSDCDDKAYHQVVHKREGHRQHRLTHVSAAALRHKYAILEHELRLQCKDAKSNTHSSHFGTIRERINTIIKSLSEECEDLGVDSPSASELFPEAELLFTASPAHDHAQEHAHNSQPIIHIPKPDLEDQIATDRLISRDMHDRSDLNIGLEDVGIVTVSEDGMQTTIALNQEEFARAHPNTTFHSEPSEEGEVQPFTIAGIKSRHITSTIFHANRAPGTVLVAAPQTTVISQATAEPAASPNVVKYADIENMIDSLPGAHNNNINLPSVLVKDDAMSRFDSLLAESREVHISNATSAIVHSSGNATQVIRRVCFDDDKREKNGKYLIDEPDAMMGDESKYEDISSDAQLGPMHDDVDDRSYPDRHAELFWESNSMAERMERRRRLDFSSDSDKCCRSPIFDEVNSDSGVGVHMRLDSVIKEARVVERTSFEGPSVEEHPPLRTYPPKRMYHNTEVDMDRSLSGKTRAGERSPDMMEVRRRSSVRGVVKRGCHCCNGSPAPPRPKKSRPKKPILDYNANN